MKTLQQIHRTCYRHDRAAGGRRGGGVVCCYISTQWPSTGLQLLETPDLGVHLAAAAAAVETPLEQYITHLVPQADLWCITSLYDC